MYLIPTPQSIKETKELLLKKEVFFASEIADERIKKVA